MLELKASFSSVMRCAVSYPPIDVTVINLPLPVRKLWGDRLLLNVALGFFMYALIVSFVLVLALIVSL